MKRLLLVFLFSMAMLACEKEVISEGYPEVEAFYDESVKLSGADIDSISRFSEKISFFLHQNPDCNEHTLLPVIRKNVRTAVLTITAICDTTWANERVVTF